MYKILLLVIFTAFSFNLSSQTHYFKDVSETQEFTKKIVNLFQESKIGEAFDELSYYWPLNQNELLDLRTQTIRYFNIFNERFGTTIGNLKTNNETIADIAIRETYLVRFDYAAIRVIITYYKNDEGWIINAFKWDDSFPEEFR